MSESTLLIAASISMLVLSLLVAAGLHWLDVGPGAVLIGGTLAGIAVYVAFCVVGGRHVKEENFIEEEQNA
jgi:hypothetical protein